MKGKKTGGRKAGTENRITSLNKEVIANLLCKYAESGKMSEDFDTLKPVDRLNISEKLLQYVTPKIQSIAIDVNSTSEKSIEDELKKLSEE